MAAAADAAVAAVATSVAAAAETAPRAGKPFQRLTGSLLIKSAPGKLILKPGALNFIEHEHHADFCLIGAQAFTEGEIVWQEKI
jgi:hypothetical protein